MIHSSLSDMPWMVRATTRSKVEIIIYQINGSVQRKDDKGCCSALLLLGRNSYICLDRTSKQ
jgi:hypothetical protein